MDTFATVGWVDWLLLAVMVLSVMLGLWRGLVFEVLALVAWVAAYLAAQWWAPAVAPHLPMGMAASEVKHAAAFTAVFVAAIVAWLVAARLLRLLIHATPLTVIDRVLGAGFGVLRGLLLLLALATVVVMTPAREASGWSSSYGAQWLTAVLQGIKPMLPGDLSHYLRV